MAQKKRDLSAIVLSLQERQFLVYHHQINLEFGTYKHMDRVQF